MKEMILYAPSLNSSEILKSLARNGVSTFGLRIFNTSELAKYILSKNGVSLTKKLLSSIDEVNVIASLYKDIPYFKNCSYIDLFNITNSIYSLRLEVNIDDEELKEKLLSSKFKEKNEGLISLLSVYLNKLDELNVLDRISLINTAIRYKVDMPIYILDEDFYNKKEVALYNCFKNVFNISLNTLYNRDEETIKINNFYQCYGVCNEIENIINYIYKNNISLDKCMICYTNYDYVKEIFEYSNLYNIPVSFSEGIMVKDTSAGKLLKALYLHQLKGVGNTSKDSFINLINLPFFDKSKLIKELFKEDEENKFNELLELFAALRLGFNNKLDLEKIDNVSPFISCNMKDKLITLNGIFNKGIFYVATTYAIDRHALLHYDNDAKNKINNFIDSFNTYSSLNSNLMLDELVDKILDLKCGSTKSSEGCLFVCNLTSALSVVKSNLFIVGLDSSFPGGPKENYLVLDDELRYVNPSTFNDSFSALNNKKQLYFNVLKLFSCLGANINLSYSDYNLIDIKEVSKSSLLFETYRKVFGDKVTLEEFEDSFIKVGFFKNHMSINDEIGIAFIENKDINKVIKIDEVTPSINLLDKVYTPTQIEKYFSCPFKFYLNYCLGIDEPITDDPFSPISAIDLGNIAHELMETFEKEKETKEEFLARCRSKINEYFSLRPPLFEYQKTKVITDFISMMENAYNMDYGNKIELVEVFSDILTIGGVKMSGKFDRLEKDGSGKYYLVDYKTKNRVEHTENDALTCLQLAIYTKLLENGINLQYKIESAEYRYFKLEKAVKFKFNEENEIIFNELIDELYNSLKTHNFEKCEDALKCKFCTMKLACTLMEGGEEEGD